MHKTLDFTEAFSLKEDLAVVAGGGIGLGYAMASSFIAAGARVVITGRRADVLQQATEKLGPQAFAQSHDVTDAESASSLLAVIREHHGLPTILVNNAGTHVKKSIEETTFEDFHNILATHVEGAFSITQATAPFMKEAGPGSMLFIASMSSLIGMPCIVAYSAAKASYLDMVRALASELGPHNIRVNGIAPGWIETPMLASTLAGDPERRQKILSRPPQQRFGNPSDIGRAAVFQSSAASSFINGVVIPIDGGASIGF